MMNSKELRTKAWESLKGKYWRAFAAAIIAGLIYSCGSLLVSIAETLIGLPEVVKPENITDAALGKVMGIIGAALVFAIVGALVSVFVGSPARVGLCNYFIKNTKEKPELSEIFSGFKTSYGRNVKTLFIVGIKTALWSLLLVIPGIIKALEYSLIPYIIAEDPSITTKEAFAKSKQMMTGNKWRLFKLSLSFIGWILLSALTLGIGVLFLDPYMEAAFAEFYEELKNK